MASALSSSNALSVSTGLYSKPDSKTLKPTVTVHAKTQSIESQSPNEGSKKANSPRRKDPNTVFVAGATGQSGTRIAQTLLRQGFAVRAGVPELSAAQELARLASTYKIISPAESKRLNAVESTFDDPEAIAKAIGPATKVVITIGSGENGPTTDVTTNDALQVIKAAELAGVGHVAVVYDSVGATISGPSSTYNVLDGITSFFSNFSSLFSGAKQLSIGEFLSKAVETDVSYTLIKAALTEDYSDESSHGIVVSKEGTIIESKVAKSQIAKLVADVFSNTEVAENKVVEVSTSPSATSKSVAELFSAIPEDGRRKAYAEAMAKAKVEEEALIASKKAREATEAAKKLEKEVKKLSDKEAEAATLVDEAKAKAEAAGFSLDNLLTKAKDLSSSAGDFSFEKLSSQISTAVSQKADKGDDELKIQIATVRGRTKARSLLPQKAVVKKATFNAKPKEPEPKSKPNKEEEKVEVRNLFGGLFKQETIYIDDD
ncbi:uncharacterized protein A4U43_C07F1420 [Asparagus officinalis]|uniref:NAD(P)-binding domain-containing protein n=1 Tax=Asparagus officinalis TaxID=4686 RepID=A0A5P1EBU7_ASPOF|nr:uncharacterized protein A4U43_C07F1420 [Asparagus officinalis]